MTGRRGGSASVGKRKKNYTRPFPKKLRRGVSASETQLQWFFYCGFFPLVNKVQCFFPPKKLIYIREVMSSKRSIWWESVSKGHVNSGRDSSLESGG